MSQIKTGRSIEDLNKIASQVQVDDPVKMYLKDIGAIKEDFYKDFVKYVDVAGQFDTDYNMPASSKPVNNRSEVTEMIGTDGVHPTETGFYQIADAAFRSLCEVFS